MFLEFTEEKMWYYKKNNQKKPRIGVGKIKK